MSTSRGHIERVLPLSWLLGLALSVTALFSVPSFGQIAPDAASNATGSASSLSWSHTVGSGTNRILVVGVSIRRANRVVNSITFGGVNLTQAGSQNSAANISRMEMWYLLNPPSGPATVTVTLAGASDFVAGAVSFSGIDQTVPLGPFASASGTGLSGSVTTASAPNEVVVDIVASPGTALSLTPGASQTSNWILGTGNAGNDVQGGSSTTAGASSVTTSWALGAATDWAIGAISLKPAPYPNIVLTMVQNSSSPPPGTTVTYAINYTNLGTGSAGSSLVAFSPPLNTTLVPNSVFLNGVRKTDAADADEVTLSGSTVTVNLGTVPSGASGSVTYDVTIQ